MFLPQLRRHLSRRIVALAALLISGFTLATVLSRPQSVTVVVGEGEPIVVNSPLIWTQWDVALLVAASVIAGASLSYLLIQEVRRPPMPLDVSPQELATVRVALRSLPNDEGVLLRMVAEEGGSILQKHLPSKTGFSPAKVSRLLQRMVEKGILDREQYGNTKKVTLGVSVMGERSL